ncbi:S8 family serine peptidase [Neobacillus niacini]|uniref:S8 family serine peptidase n=1 Tax=Neobacillus niacini TaxID=86668 RepID=UPI0005EE6444|nr:S8 family serine peptidase [Neobacillus niacini]
MKKEFMKKATALALGVGLVSSSLVAPYLNSPSRVHAVTTSSSESILANLTPEQRQALTQLSTNDQTGLFLDSNVNVDSDNQVSVIVSFKNKPQKIAILESAVNGKSLSNDQAKNNAEADHVTFKKDLDSLFKDKSDGLYKVKREYKHAFNGVALEVPANKLNELMKSDAVLAIYSDVIVQAEPSIEPSSDSKGQGMADERSFLKVDQLHQEGYTGKGVKVAVLDTGIDYNHPDLKDAYKGGYDFVNNDSDPMETTYEDWIKAGKPGGNAAAYVTEHGTHVAGTIAGQGKNESEYATKGIAPDAQVYAYRVLGPGGSGTAEGIIAAIDHAVSEGMDVMNLSLGANYNNPMYPTSIAINNAVLSGVTAVVAAGNAGNKMYTLGSPGTAALALTVGASNVPISTLAAKGAIDNVSADLRFMARGYTDDITKLKGQTNTIVDVGLGDNYTGKDVKGKIVLMSRGVYTLDSKIAFAKAQGAAAVLMYNDNAAEGHIPSHLGEGVNFIPTFSLSNADGLALKQKLQAGSASFTFNEMSEMKTVGDTLADFSSRGPSRVTYDIKPEITAPGVSVLSTVPSFINSPNDPTNYSIAYKRMSGTSMATPFTSGVAALLLQAKPELEPEEVKAILMNTADPLSKSYSVYEAGAGRVDPYQAIHSTIELKVKDKTPTIINGKEKQIKEDTGALSFGNEVFNGKNIKDSRSVTIENNGSKDKTFDVSVTYQTDVRGSKDAVKNGVVVSTDKSIKVPGNSNVASNVTLSIPTTAEKGIYEGYIVYTNHDDPSETYRVPFGAHFVEEGFQDLSLERQTISSNRTNVSNIFYNPVLFGSFTLKSHMRYIDVVLEDTATGKDVGFIGTIDGVSRDEGVQYGGGLFMGYYYPFTNDKNNPIGLDAVLAPEGHYKLKFIGYNDSGKSFTTAQDLYVDNTMPSKYDVHLDGEKEGNPFVEYKQGQQTVPLTASINDKMVDEMKAAGMNVNQSINQIYYFYNSHFPNGQLTVDENGNVKDEVATDPKGNLIDLEFEGIDQATNSYGRKVYYVVPDNYQYVYGQPNTPTRLNKVNAHIGDTITITLTANNVNKIKQASYRFTTKYADTTVESIALNPAAQKLGGTLNVTSTPGSTSVTSNVNVTFDGTSEVTGDIPMVDVTIKIPNMKDGYTASSFSSVSSTFTSVDGTVTRPFTAIAPITIQPNFSTAISYIHPEGFHNENGLLRPQDYTKVGANVTIKDSQGKTYTGTMDKVGQFYITGLPVTRDYFTVIQDIPGHFTTYGQFTNAYKTMDGVDYGYNKRLSYPDEIGKALGGDVNKDNVIDLMDALAIQKYWGTNERSADINFDGIVDTKDFAYVEKNFGMQNPTVDNAPKPVNQVKGKTLADIKKELGL